jgi:hypothetical protein
MAESKDTIKSTLETIGRIIAPITVITALLYYFGWIRTGAIFGRFGVDQRVLAYSVDDYLLRSAGVAFRPLAFLLLGVATSVAIWYGLTRIANRPKTRQTYRCALIHFGHRPRNLWRRGPI